MVQASSRAALAAALFLAACLGVRACAGPPAAATDNPPDGAPDGASEALATFRRAFDSRDPRVRLKALAILEGVPGPGAVAGLLDAAADPEAPVRARARDLLRGRQGEEDLRLLAERGLRHEAPPARLAAAALLAAAGEAAGPYSSAIAGALRDREPSVREAAAAALGATGDRGQAPVVAAALRAEGDPEARGGLLLALHALDRAAGTAEAARVAEGDDAGPPCVAALRVLGAACPDGAVAAGVSLLRHGAWEARMEAAVALGRAEGAAPRAVGALVAALPGEKRRRVRAALVAALERLTGRPFGEDAARWSAWWAKEREGWTPPRAAGPVGPDAPSPLGDRPGPRAEDRTVARFYSIPVDTDRLAFVLDTSKSMLDPAAPGKEATKMELAVAEVAGTLAGLRDGTSFNMLLFGSEVRRWKGRTVPASPEAKHEALRFLQKQTPGGRTNIFDALAASFDDTGVDTVFLLTDGAPSAGEETTRTGFLEGLAHLRRWRPVRVHCVEVGAPNTGARWKGFLADVAAATGGIHVAR